MHYGYTDEQVKRFHPSLANMNAWMAQYAQIWKGEKVLDAGCGLGETAIFLAQTLGGEVTSISLSAEQIAQGPSQSSSNKTKPVVCSTGRL